MIVNINRVKQYSNASGDYCAVTVEKEDGSKKVIFCYDKQLLPALIANEGKSLEVEMDEKGKNIISIPGIKCETETPAEPEVKPEPQPEAPAEEAAPPAKETKPKTTRKKQDSPAEEAPASDENIKQETTGLSDKDELFVEQMFPKLKAEEIDVRIGQIYDSYITLLLYKDARCDQNRLDAKYGPMGWQSRYHIIDGQLFCEILVRDNNTGEWVGKMDVGTPSNTEAEKGRASDAFKRAAVCWGSGRELYTAPEIRVYAKDTEIKPNNKGKQVCYDKFTVKAIGYDERGEINRLEIYGAKKKDIVFRFKK